MNKFLLILTLICSRAVSFEFPIIETLESEVLDVEEDVEGAVSVIEKVVDKAAASVLSTVWKIAGEKKATAKPDSIDCVGGISDFIQCMARAKIENFSQVLSKLAFPSKPHGDFDFQRIDSKVESSVGNWVKNFIKHSKNQKPNCTTEK